MSYTKTAWVDNISPYISAENLNHAEQGIYDAHTGAGVLSSVDTVTALKALTGISDGATYTVSGYYAATDGGGGIFRYNASSSATANGGTVIAPNSGSGRWERVFEAGPINVKWFGATGDGTTDDSTPFANWASYMASLTQTQPTTAPWPDGAGERVGRAEGYVPAGAYLITQANNAFIAPPPTAVNVQGLTIRGAGRYVTQIIYKPATISGDSYLVTNSGATGSVGWLAMHFEDIAFHRGTSGASWMLSIGPAVQNYTFTRVNWVDFKYGIRLQGTDNNSEFTFNHCSMRGTWTHFLWSETSDQFLNFHFTACEFEVDQGNWIRMTEGGNVDIYGGSAIQNSPTSTANGTFFLLENASHADSVQRFFCQGVRFEHRNQYSRIINSAWGSGTVTFDSCNDDSYATASYGPTSVTATFNAAIAPFPVISWRACSLEGHHEYVFDGNQYGHTEEITYENCQFRNWERAVDFLVITNSDSNGNLGGTPLVKFRNCRGNYSPYGTMDVFDTDFNWQLKHQNNGTKKQVFLKTPFGVGPFATFTTATIRLPYLACITGITLFSPAFGTSTSTTWSYTVQTSETTPTVLATAAGGGTSQLKNGFHVEQSLFYMLDADPKTVINLVANANVDQQTTGFICKIEYVG